MGKIPQAPYARENYGQIDLKKQVLAVKTGGARWVREKITAR